MVRRNCSQLHKRSSAGDNRGMTLVEMIVSFALLSIFVVASTIIISSVISLYYRVRGESYSRQVGDIVTNKISSEISGALYSSENDDANIRLCTVDDQGNPVSGNAVDLYDRTDTHIRMFAQDGILKIYYYSIDDQMQPENNRTSVYWTFDKKVYNGFEIEKLDFAQANTQKNVDLAEEYGVSGVSKDDYPSNIIAVYMKLKSGKYGSFTIYRYIRVYEAPENGFSVGNIE
ncbi:MAG: prepilin-type N-terminal cleavage/methylation domain-containing protein [Eubacterium sp.]|nr:prepilin-type N-terminal cleavage/methylation domain-containing protein [Eubacterium sp.]